jgi:hypothetical protein
MTVGLIVLGVVLGLALIGVAFWRGYQIGKNDGFLSAKETVNATREAFEHCRDQWEEWERKAESYRSLNSSILNERDKWQHLYGEQSVAHGNAQAMMMGTIEYMGKKLTRSGISFQIPAVLEEVRQQYIENHVTPVLAERDRAEPKPEKSSEKSEQVG